MDRNIKLLWLLIGMIWTEWRLKHAMVSLPRRPRSLRD